MGRYLSHRHDRSVANVDVQKIIDVAKGYDAALNGRTFLVTYGDELSSGLLEIAFNPENFAHLVGIDTGKTNLSATDIFNYAVHDKLKGSDLNGSLSSYFRKKIRSAKYLKEFANVVSDVSAVDPSSSKIAGQIWISKHSVNFALGALAITMEQTGGKTYIPNTLQWLNEEKLIDKSSGDLLPITCILARKIEDIEYSEIRYVSESLSPSQHLSITIAMNSFGDKDQLREEYPALTEEFLGPEQPQNHDKQTEDLDSIMAAYSFEDELQDVNSRRHEIEDEIKS